jgi:pimeloyl-ACP methyl ester carboxylesterase
MHRRRSAGVAEAAMEAAVAVEAAAAMEAVVGKVVAPARFRVQVAGLVAVEAAPQLPVESVGPAMVEGAPRAAVVVVVACWPAAVAAVVARRAAAQAVLPSAAEGQAVAKLMLPPAAPMRRPSMHPAPAAWTKTVHRKVRCALATNVRSALPTLTVWGEQVPPAPLPAYAWGARRTNTAREWPPHAIQPPASASGV